MTHGVRRVLFVLLIPALLLLFLAWQFAAQPQSSLISVQETKSLLASDSTVLLLDVRTPGEHETERIDNTPLIPLQSLEGRMEELEQYRGSMIIVYCRSGNRSGTAAAMLRESGYNAVNMTGGIIRWKSEGFPVLRGTSQ